MTRSAIVLAGGRSQRFGATDKATALLDGRPMVRHVADRLAPVVDELVVSCRATQVGAIREALATCERTPRFAIDDVPDRGPVHGLGKALRVSDATKATVTACDMPLLDPDFLDFLFGETAGNTGAVPVFDDHPQPLCAVYDVEATLRAIHEALAAGEPGLTTLLDRLDPHIVREPEVRDRTGPETFRNVNTRAELRAVERSSLVGLP